MKKKLPKGKVRCGACNKTLSTQKEIREHFKSEKHLRRANKIKKEYEKSLDELINYKG